MTLHETILNLICAVEAELSRQDAPNGAGEILITHRRLVASSNTMWVYSCGWDHTIPMTEEVPVKVRVKGSQALTEGRVVGFDNCTLWLGVRKNLGAVVRPAYVQPDVSSIFQSLTRRLHDIERNLMSMVKYPFGQLFSDDLSLVNDETDSSVQIIDLPHSDARRERVTEIVLEGLREGKRILLTSAHNRNLDENLIAIVRVMRMEGLSYSTLVTRYPALVLEGKGTTDLRELAFEQQLRANVGRVQAEQNILRSAFHRYQKLAPIVALAQEKIRDLEEVEALEDRLLRAIDKLECKDTDLRINVETYADTPLWQRLSMQVGGKNPPTMHKMRSWCAEQLEELRQELLALYPRLSKARQEAYLAPEIWEEYERSKETVEARGGIENVRSLIAVDQGELGHVFEGRGLVAATAGCVASHDLFNGLSFDTVIVDGIDAVPLPLLIPATCLARKKIVLVGAQSDSQVATVMDGSAERLRVRIACLRTSILETCRAQAVAASRASHA
ncbi:MAG: hypothetical protein CMH81_07905 [Nitrospiraceae bacterium]|nr:hypothetical protein [Nitrospiraceae bacterium]